MITGVDLMEWERKKELQTKRLKVCKFMAGWIIHMEADVIENDNKTRVERKTEPRAKFLGGWKKEHGRPEDDYRDYQVV